MSKKKNNGNKLQNYNPKNGEYLGNDSNENYELNMILNWINKNKTKQVKFPTMDSSLSYINEYINEYVNYDDLIINPSKIDLYLLDTKNHYDKAHYFVDILGFNLNNKNDFIKQIRNEIINKKKFFKDFSKFGISIYCIAHLSGKFKEGNALIGILITKQNVAKLITGYAIKGDKNERIE